MTTEERLAAAEARIAELEALVAQQSAYTCAGGAAGPG
jgi:hypothetical protein